VQAINQPEILSRAGKQLVIEQEAIMEFRIENFGTGTEEVVNMLLEASPTSGSTAQGIADELNNVELKWGGRLIFDTDWKSFKPIGTVEEERC
jgi:hypothetical protein